MHTLRLIAAILSIAMAGCAPINLRGNGFGDSSSTWGRQLRPTTKPGEMLGVDARAREIEQNLGIR